MHATAISRRRFLQLTGSALSVGVLAACVPAAQAPSQAENADAGAAPAAEPLAIRYMTTLTQPERLTAQETLLEKFQEANPNITATLESASWGEAQAKLLAMVAAADAPDVSTAGNGWPLLFANQGAIRAMDDVIETMGGREAFFETELAADFYEGTQWAVPLYQTPDVMIYRKDYFDAAGVTVPDINTDYAFTWNDYAIVAEQTTNDEYFGLVEPMADIHGYKPIWGLLLTNGVTIFNEAGELAFNLPETIETYEYVAALYQKASPAGMTTYQMGDNETAFRSGKAAATILNTGLVRTIALNEPELLTNLGVTPVPVNKERGSFKGNVKVVGYETANKEAANEFLRFWYQPENYQPFLLAYAELMLPSMPVVADAESYKNAKEFEPTQHLMEPAILTLPYAAGIVQKFGANPYGGAIEGNLVIQNVLIDMMTQGTPAAEAVAKGEAAIREIMEA
ncbi:MAG: extracellular solute-binding protein [Caldilineaceae bacterium]